ncbi:MAG: hypothetical protein N3F67_04570 [Acidilobaceae archaeon]|nr:hypothetical protein [Acidilobaceae archaeon]
MRTYLAALGLALLLLLALGTVVAAAKPWKMAGEIEGKKGISKEAKVQRKANVTLVEIKGKVVSLNATKRTFTVEAQDGKRYEIRLHRIYVRVSDGALVFGGWIYRNIQVGEEVSAVIAENKRAGIYVALSITVDGQTYQTPRYFMRG